ncbi:phage portal protein [Comamonas antarctica]|uniref:phage portal protein n=1 Tax=Comamonas antarctica TaxID=2743470 RepID=UPI0028E7F8E1|nr:phage portal protein [Comamonas antarctica]
MAAAAPTEQEIAMGRAALHFLNRYDAAGRGRRMASWNPPSSGPNVAIDSGMQTLRDRSSDTVRNDWSGTSIVQNWATTLVGIAITPRFRRVTNKTRRKELNDLWVDFVKVADADGVLDLYGMQTLAVRSWIERGEMFARRRYRRPSDNLPVPLQVQLLEADMLPNFNSTAFQGMAQGSTIKSGIEIDRRGKKTHYWFYKEHPGDGALGVGGTPDPTGLVRVPAEDVIHMFEPKRIGARRGVPEMSPVLPRLRGINDFEDVTLERQKIANLFVAFISRALPQITDPTDPNLAALTGMAAELDDGTPLLPMKPGLLQELEDGQSVTFANPPEPATNYSDYMRTSHLGTAAGAGLPYELMSGDIRGVSDRALRVVMNEFRRFAQQRQWQIVIPMFCQRVVQWFAEAAVLAGKAQVSEIDSLIRVEHAPHGWEYLHPVQDVQGKKMEVEAGFRSRSSVVSESGDDPDVVDQERADDATRERQLGLPVTGTPEGYVDPEAEPDPEEDTEDAGPTPAQQVADAARQRASAVAAQQKAERAEAAAREAREQEIHQTMLELLGMQVDG